MRVFLLIAALFLAPQSTDKQQIAAFSKSMESAPAKERVAYNALQVAFATFTEAHLRHESCKKGTDCVAMRAVEEQKLTRSFVLLTQGFPHYAPKTQEAVESSDQALNLVYQTILDSLPVTCPTADASCTTQAALRDVERDWIRYRDAWIVFGSLHWPQSSQDFWQVILTDQRTEQMKAPYAPQG